MLSLKPKKQHYDVATFQLLLAAAFVVAVHSDCDLPPRFSFAELREEYRQKKIFAVNDVVEYNCRPGYTKKQKTSLQCMKNSEWFGNTEFCKAKSCSHPGDPENGRVVILTDLTFGATVNFTCEEGYRLIGSVQRRCVLEGSQVSWDRDIPYCQLIPCLPPPEIENGRHTGLTLEEFNYGTSVTYQCDTVARGQVPFSLVGEASVHCTSRDNVNGEWSSPAPECKAIRCQQPTVDHGKQVTGYSLLYTYKALVMFECDLRYTLKGSNILECNENNRWAPQLPVCERSSCDDPPHILNTFQNSSNSQLFPAGTVVKYDCKRGYELIPGISSAIVTCQKDFTWSEHTDFCQKIKCPYPHVDNGKETPSHGSRRETYVYEDHIKIQCNDGYSLKNGDGRYHDEWIKCDYNGAWHRPLPVCQPVCGTPPRISNGQPYHQENVFPIGSVVTYSCNKGWSLSGEASIRCLGGDGIPAHWQEPAPECKEILCSRPDIENGIHEIAGYLYQLYSTKYKLGVSVTFTCNRGYNLKGRDRSNCVENGQWDPPLPSCSPACGTPPPISNGWHYRQEKVFPIGSVVTYSCNKGWSLSGEASIRCLGGDGIPAHWQEPAPECKEILCSRPDIENGIHEIAGYLYRLYSTKYKLGVSVTFTCNRGYNLKGRDRSNCVENGQWDPPLPSCSPGRCSNPPAFEYAERSDPGEFLVGTTVTYSCKSGYTLIPGVSPSVTCLENFRWSEVPELCQEIHCQKPVVENGKQVSTTETEYTYGSSVEFKCDSDYILKGNASINCEANGIWNPPVPSCIKVRCPKPDVQNGRMVNGLDEKMWYNMSESITFVCSPGYQFSDHWYLSATDSLNITCSADGTWTVLPKCKKQSDAPVCKMVRESRKFLHCGVPLAELRTLLEVQKLYLEIQKLKRDLQKYNE